MYFVIIAISKAVVKLFLSVFCPFYGNFQQFENLFRFIPFLLSNNETFCRVELTVLFLLHLLFRLFVSGTDYVLRKNGTPFVLP